MRHVKVSGEGFGPITATEAISFRERLLGLAHPGAGDNVILTTRSVHTLGRRSGLAVVGLDDQMRVVSTRVIQANRLTWMPGARRILEMPADAPMPGRGVQLAITHA